MKSNESAFRGLFRAAAIVAVLTLAGCVWQPLYNDGYASSSPGGALSQVSVSEVDSRTAQQVRNHLIFLLQGGRDAVNTRYEARIRVRAVNKELAAIKDVRDFTAGSVTVSVSYDLIDKTTNTRVAGGSRTSSAPYDRTNQNFANSRAVRDAQNRAARDVAEQLRLAIAADLAG